MAIAKSETSKANLWAAIFAIFAVACIVAFLAFRGSDVGRLPQLVGSLSGGPLFGSAGVVKSLLGALTALLTGVAWFGTGSFVFSFLGLNGERRHSLTLDLALPTAFGAAIWSLCWFFLGLANMYQPMVAGLAVVFGVAMAVYRLRPVLRGREPGEDARFGAFQYLLVALTALPLLLALVSSLAPPIAKDTLLYHFALPEAFVSAGGIAFIQGNIASYLALGTEMHIVWAMLLGGIVSPDVGEAAAGATTFLFFPLLIAVVYGWARELEISRTPSLAAAMIVAAIPTAYHVAASGYVDLSLALYVTLAIYAFTHWWTRVSVGWMITAGVFLGAALSVKLTALFVLAAVALLVLVRARNAEASAGKIILTGFGSLLLAGLIASPWYIRTWAATGSPVFPFYMNIWKGEAAGWDVERSNLFQAMNSQYGGADVEKLNYFTAPVRVSVAAQPEQPRLYDGVLGVAFLIGFPLMAFALWKLDLAREVKIAAAVAAIMYLFWLFSSEQLRYLLPIAPLLSITIAASVDKVSDPLKRFGQYALAAAGAAGVLTTFAWFSQKAPLRVVLGGEARQQYLTRGLDYFSFYEQINNDTPPDARVWLINMRRDTYHIDRPVLSDYLFEDWTLRKMLWESQSVAELRAKTAAMGVTHVLARHDFLFDFARTTLVDEKRPRVENEAKLLIAKEFLLDPASTVKADKKFSLFRISGK